MALNEKWVVVTPAVPIESDFNGTHGLGSPIVISETDDTAYYLKGSTITPLAGSGGGGGSWIPLVDGSEPPVFITDGAGVLILVAGP